MKNKYLYHFEISLLFILKILYLFFIIYLSILQY
nr:MAG TPA: hypothetical protein [Caudoviricetes sp.]